jgi:ribose-phosphate pyrophosphokinase
MKNVLFFLDKGTSLTSSLSEELTKYKDLIQIGDVETQLFSDGEVSSDYKTSVRGKRVYVVSSPNTSDKIMQLMLALDSATRSGAKEIIPIIPYYPYARSDKRDNLRGPIGAKVMAEMIENRGATSIITFDFHADQIQGFFNIPVLHMEGKFVFDKYINDLYIKYGNKLILCSPDVGGTKRVKALKDRVNKKYGINPPMVIINKERIEANVVGDMELIGNVNDKFVAIIDDMADTCGTLLKAHDYLLEEGAIGVSAIVTHPVLSGNAYQKVMKMGDLVCTDTLDVSNGANNIISLSVAPQLIKSILSTAKSQSLEYLKTH